MDLNNVTLQQIFQWMTGTGIASVITIAIIRFFGKALFTKLVSDVLKEEYESSLKDKVAILVSSRLNDSAETTKKDVDEMLEKHFDKCKSANLEINDSRYLLRQEFRMFLENQSNQNERVENNIAEIRNVCNEILLRLTKQ